VRVHDDIFEWVSSFPPWKQDLLLEAMSSPPLTDGQISRATDQLLGDPAAGAPREIDRTDLPTGASPSGTGLLLDAICDVDGVNALARGQRLDFAADGISLIYGRNGAGKTGYCRILKFCGRTLSPEDVRGHVAPAASVSAVVDGEPQLVAIDFDGAPPAQLGTIHVFDAHAADHYVSREHTVDYIPLALRVIERFADALQRVGNELDRRAEAAQDACPPLDVSTFRPHTATGRLLAGLTAQTPDEEIRRLATLSKAEQITREHLTADLAEIRSHNASQLRADAQARRKQVVDLHAGLVDLTHKLGADATRTAHSELEWLGACEQAAGIAAAKLDRMPLPGAGTEGWRVMYDAARAFAEHDARHPLPPSESASGVRCPLCMQELDDDARQRLLEFDAFVHANVNAQVAAARRAVRVRRDALPDIDAFTARYRDPIDLVDAPDDRQRNNETDQGDDRSPRPVAAWLAEATKHVTRIADGRLADGTGCLPELPAVIKDALSRIDAEVEHHARLERPDQEVRVEADLAELDDRAALAKRLDVVMHRLTSLRVVAALRAAKPQAASTGASTKLTQLCRSFIDADLEGALNRQLRALDFRGLDVRTTTRTAAGQPMVRLALKTVDETPLQAVLSAGEQRRLALGMFLAECEACGDGAPVIMDDPCCSLDQEGRRHIARSLAALAADRQVIVFTHDLPFVARLREAADMGTTVIDVHVQHVVRLDSAAGIVRGGLPWEGLRPSDRVAPLGAKLSAAAAHATGDPDVYRQLTEDFYNYLRQAYERVTEADLFGGAIERGNDAIHTQQLTQTLLGHDDIVALVQQGMTQTSTWLHDRAAADNPLLPTVDEMTDALESYQQLLARIKAVRSERERAKRDASAQRRATLQAADGMKPLGDAKRATPIARESAGTKSRQPATDASTRQLPLGAELDHILPAEHPAGDLPPG
jgi:ABC-type transport system involved in cytochrome c biogenesis ATPase subunit